MFELRPYQTQAVRDVLAAWETSPSLLGVAATGAGKTVIFLALAKELTERDPSARVLILAHREELLDQPVERAALFGPEFAAHLGIVAAERDQYDARVVVASVQTVRQTKRLERILSAGVITHVITDEAHHATATSYRTVYEALRAANTELRHLGVTATPKRTDHEGLVAIFGSVVFKYGIKELVGLGYLVPFKALAVETGISLQGVHVDAGDYRVSDLRKVFELDNCFELVAETHLRYAPGRRGLAFTASVAGAYRLAEVLSEAGISAAAADGTTPKEERREILRRFRAGELDILVNCGLWTEGLDVPEVSVIHQVRPTKSDLVYCLDSDTEVLTPTGFQGMSNVDTIESVAAMDPTTGSIEWTSVTGRIVRPVYSGERMVSVQGPSIDIRVTENHQMLMRHRRSPNHSWRFMEAGTLAARKSEYDIPVAGVQSSVGVPLTDDELRVIGWYVTDGTRNRKNNQITLSQSVDSLYNTDIRSCLNGAGISFVETVIARTEKDFANARPLIRYTLHRGRHGRGPRSTVGVNKLEPYLDKNLSPLLDDVSPRQLSVLLEAIHLGDGSKHNGQSWTRRSYHIGKGNRVFAERLQSLCVRRGFRCNVSTLTKQHKNPLYFIHIGPAAVRRVGGSSYTDRQTLAIGDPALGENVWCVENQLGTLVIRRHGKVSIVGNCQMAGRGLRPVPGKSELLILDYVPLESRDVVMAGDLLGKPREQKKVEKAAEKAGVILEAFSFTGEGTGIDGDPDEIVMRELNYLTLSPFAWFHNDGLSTLGCGEGRDRIDRTLALALNRTTGRYGLVVIERVRGAEARIRTLGTSEDFSALAEQGAGYADEYGSAVLAQREKAWRRQSLTEKQLALLRRLLPGKNGELSSLSRGDASKLITHQLALATLDRARAQQAARRATSDPA